MRIIFSFSCVCTPPLLKKTKSNRGGRLDEAGGTRHSAHVWQRGRSRRYFLYRRRELEQVAILFLGGVAARRLLPGLEIDAAAAVTGSRRLLRTAPERHALPARASSCPRSLVSPAKAAAASAAAPSRTQPTLSSTSAWSCSRRAVLWLGRLHVRQVEALRQVLQQAGQELVRVLLPAKPKSLRDHWQAVSEGARRERTAAP